MSSTKDGSKIPVKFDVTASAKVGWEVKGEIPSSSLGRLVDSFTDMIRPFSESRGLKADLLRLQREDVLYDITRRAVERLQLEGREVKPIPVKTLVPLLEKASLEDPESDMIDWWVGLLAETSQDQGLQHPVYSDLLSKITSAEASYLQKMLAVSLPSVLDADEVNIEEIFRREVDTKLSPLVSGSNDQKYHNNVREHVNQFRLSLEENACVVFYLNYPAGNLKFSRNLNEKFVPFGRSYQDITDVLRSVSIAKTVFLTFPMPSPFIGEVSCSMEIFVLTSLGRKLLRSCVANVQTLNPKS